MSKPSIAVLGASGGCAGYALASALQNGHHCRALARDPDKLTKNVLEKGITQSVVDSKLTVVPGNGKNTEDIKKLLVGSDGKVVDKVLFGIGGSPSLHFSWNPVTLDDPTVCQTAMAALLAALSELAGTNKSGGGNYPHVALVSTTGITSGPRDVPFLLGPLYHWLLATPHEDKREMEALVVRASATPQAERGFADFTVVRPTLLVDGDGYGLDKVRVGVEEAPTLGYTVARKDVGLFIYEEILKSEVAARFKGEKVTLTN